MAPKYQTPDWLLQRRAEAKQIEVQRRTEARLAGNAQVGNAQVESKPPKTLDECASLEEALRLCLHLSKNNITGAARRLGVSKDLFVKKMRENRITVGG